MPNRPNPLALAVLQMIEATAHAGPRAAIPGRIELKARGASAAEVYIYGDIGESWWGESITAKDVVDQLNELDAAVKTIDVYINSYGGSVHDGLAIYNALKRKAKAGITVHTHVDGIAASIASLIAMAGEQVHMARNTRLMIHAPWGALYIAGNAAEVREAAEDFATLLDGMARAMAESYAAKTGRPVDEMLALLEDGVDHWYSAEEAKDAGFCDVISDEPEQADAAALAVEMLAAEPAFARYLQRMPAQLAASLRRPGRGAAPVSPAAAGAIPPAKPGNHEEPTMPQAQNPAAAPQQPSGNTATIDQSAFAAAMAAVRARNEQVRAALEPHLANPDIRALHDEALANPEMSIEDVNAKALRILAAGAAPVGSRGHVEPGRDETDREREAKVSALLARAGILQGEAAERARQGNPYATFSLISLAETSLIRAGVNTRQMSREEIARRALAQQSTSDFPILLENALHKVLLTGYSTAPFTWNRFCAIGTLSDYRPHPRYHLSSFSDLLPAGEGGEYKNGTLGDGQKEVIQGSRKGRILQITPEVLVNDDLGAFTRVALALGQAAGRTIEKDVYALFGLNSGNGPTMSDGNPLFHASHGNIAGSGAAPSVAAFDAARQALASQKDPGGNDYLDITAAIWLGPLALGGQARVVNDAQYDVDVSNKFQVPNKVRGMVRDVVDTPRLAGNAWYLLADPAIEPVFEVAFLDGVQTPTLEQEVNFRSDGLSWKVVHKYGVAAVGYRGIHKNPGA